MKELTYYTEDELAILLELVEYHGEEYRKAVNSNVQYLAIKQKDMINLFKKIKIDYLNTDGSKKVARLSRYKK